MFIMFCFVVLFLRQGSWSSSPISLSWKTSPPQQVWDYKHVPPPSSICGFFLLGDGTGILLLGKASLSTIWAVSSALLSFLPDLFIYLLFWDRVLWVSDWPWTYYIAEDDLELMILPYRLYLLSNGITGMYHHTWFIHIFLFWNKVLIQSQWMRSETIAPVCFYFTWMCLCIIKRKSSRYTSGCQRVKAWESSHTFWGLAL